MLELAGLISLADPEGIPLDGFMRGIGVQRFLRLVSKGTVSVTKVYSPTPGVVL